MSGTKDTGGPAFPAVIPLVHSERQGKDYPDYSEAGMTLRDYFAAKAMQAQVGNLLKMGDDEAHRVIARRAYRMADAMLKARDQ